MTDTGPISAAPVTALLDLREISYRYNNQFGIEDISFTVERGQIVVLLGPNGAGKSTLLRCVAGVRPAQRGEVRLDGADPSVDRAARARVGVVPQNNAVFETLTVAENLHAFGMLLGLDAATCAERVTSTLEMTGLTSRAGQRADSLSGGMLRMLNLGAGLLHDPPLILLDEPTVGIDRAAQRRFRTLLRALKARGKAILLTTHDLQEAELVADHVLVLADGKLRGAGRMDRLIRDAFGERRELRVVLEPPDAGGEERQARRTNLVAHLQHLRLDEEEVDTVWAGVVEPDDPHCMALLEDAEQPAPVVVQWTLGKPGLGRLIDLLSQARD